MRTWEAPATRARVLEAAAPTRDAWHLRPITGGLLVQDPHRFVADRADWRVVTARQPTEAEGADAVAASYLDAAAEQAEVRGATAAAAELSELAADLTPADPTLSRSRRLRAASFHRLAGDSERAVSMLEQLLLEVPHVARDVLRILERLERFHLFAELFLDADVRPPLPVGDVAQLLDFRHQRRLHRLAALDDLFVVLLGRQWRHRAERGPHVAQRALAGLERELGPRGERFDAREHLLQPRQRLAPLALILFVRRGVARRERRVGRVDG